MLARIGAWAYDTRMSGGAAPIRRLYGIQYLRALAAIAVLAFHAFEADDTPWGLLALGVDLFFVLSGFLMVAITDRDSRPLAFFRDRFLRVVPVYWLVTLCALLLFSFSRLSPEPVDGWHAFASFAFIPALQPGSPSLFPLVPPGWSLNYEMLFYAVFAALLILPRRLQIWALTTILLTSVVLGRLVQPEQAILQAWSHPILLEFLAGAWLGVAWQQGGRLWPVLLASIPLTLAAYYLLISPGGWWHGRIIFIPMILAMLVSVLTLERRGNGIPDWRIPRLLGDASYSIYLWQFFAVIAGAVLAGKFGMPQTAVVTFVFIAGLTGGVAAYLWIERPLQLLLGRYRKFRRGVPIPAGV